MVKVAAAALVAAAAVLLALHNGRRSAIPAHLLGHSTVFVENFLSPEIAHRLMDTAKSIKTLPSLADDSLSYAMVHEHIGEAVPIGADGRCAHPYLVPNSKRDSCILPGRIDIGRHFLLTGGVDGLKERLSTMTARLLAFGSYIFDITRFPVFAELFATPKFTKAAADTCPPDKQVIDPFQFNYIVQLPGQTVATHLDGVYFFGASRFVFPQWLLAVMKFSGLFEAQFVPQIQIVAYFHTWTDSRGGEFVYWDTDSPVPKRVPPTAFAGSAVDGSKVVHSATVYQPTATPLLLDKSRRNKLVFADNDTWTVFSDDAALRNYSTDDIRWAVVYRARCFATDEERLRFAAQKPEDSMTLESILATLEQDLVRRGRLSAHHGLSTMDFALKLLDEYIKYPLPAEATFPINFCAAVPSWFPPWFC